MPPVRFTIRGTDHAFRIPFACCPFPGSKHFELFGTILTHVVVSRLNGCILSRSAGDSVALHVGHRIVDAGSSCMGAKSICYYSITDLRNTAFISISDNFSLDHRHWVSHSESNARPFCIKLLVVAPKSNQTTLLPPFSYPSSSSLALATYHRFGFRPMLGPSPNLKPPILRIKLDTTFTHSLRNWPHQPALSTSFALDLPLSHPLRCFCSCYTLLN